SGYNAQFFPFTYKSSIHYLWTFGDGSTSTTTGPTHTYASAGTYYVCLTVTDTSSSGKCSAQSCDSVTIVAPPPPVCNAKFSFYFNIHNYDSVHFYPPTNPTGSHYYWTFGDGNTSTDQAPWHLYATSGTYYVCLTVTDSTSSGKCSDTHCDSVKVT